MAWDIQQMLHLLEILKIRIKDNFGECMDWLVVVEKNPRNLACVMGVIEVTLSLSVLLSHSASVRLSYYYAMGKSGIDGKDSSCSQMEIVDYPGQAKCQLLPQLQSLRPTTRMFVISLRLKTKDY